jgi:hypothetical protein
MKKIILGLVMVSSFSAFANCIDHAAFADNHGIYEWCPGDKVYVEKTFNSNQFDTGVITKVSMNREKDFNSIKITVDLSNAQKIIGPYDSYKTKGCHLYSLPWGSKVRCVGDTVEIPLYFPRTNVPTGDFENGKIIAIGFKFALVRKPDGSIITRGQFNF